MQNDIKDNKTAGLRGAVSRYYVVDASDLMKPYVCHEGNNESLVIAYAQGCKPQVFKGIATETDDDGNVADHPISSDPFCMLILDREAPDLLLCSITS